MSFKWKVALAFGIALVALVIVGVLFYRRILQTDEGEQWIAHTHSVREKMGKLLIDVVSADTAQRDYMLTGNGADLAPCREKLANISDDVTEARQLTSDNPSSKSSSTK